MQFLVIKAANNIAARRYATENDVRIEIEGHSSRGTEVYALAPDEDLPQIIAWYARDAGWAGPLEDGSLLWYAERK